MRKQVNEIVRIVSESLPKKIKVLEIGSLIVEGQEHLSVRKYFPEAEYIGVDMQKGNGVDVVDDFIDFANKCDSENFDGTGYCYDHEEEFDLILCLDMLEHAKEPFEVIESAKQCLKPNGVLLVTSVFNFPIHEYPNDYWRFTPECFKMLLRNDCRVYKIGSELMPHTIIGIQYPENMFLNINTEINKYCDDQTEKELKWKNIVDYFPPHLIKFYMKTKTSILALTKAFFILLVSCCLFISCDDAGVTSKRLNGDEKNLPDELKGLKIYSVSTGCGDYVKVAVLDGKINSTTYQDGKIQETTVIVNKQNGKLIEVSQILVENDSVIVCRK